MQVLKNVMAVISVVGGVGLIIILGGMIASMPPTPPSPPPPEPTSVERCAREMSIQSGVFGKWQSADDFKDLCKASVL